MIRVDLFPFTEATMKLIISVLVSICISCGLAWSLNHVRQEKSGSVETKNGSASPQEKTKQQVDPEKQRVELEKKVKAYSFYRKVHKKLVKKLMRAVHRGPDAPLVVLDAAAKSSQKNKASGKPVAVDWDVLSAKAKMVQIMADALASPGSENGKPGREKGYAEVAKSLVEATKQKKLDALNAGVAKLNRTCSACHGWAPPQ